LNTEHTSAQQEKEKEKRKGKGKEKGKKKEIQEGHPLVNLLLFSILSIWHLYSIPKNYGMI
jgi:hypothetical protein